MESAAKTSAPAKRRREYEAECVVCNKPFRHTVGTATRYRRTTCSAECSHKLRTANRAGQSLPGKATPEKPREVPVVRIDTRPPDLEPCSFRQLEAIIELPPDVRQRLGLVRPTDAIGRRELDSGPSGPGKRPR